MGVLPLEFLNNNNRKNLDIIGDEKISILGIDELTPNKILQCKIVGKKIPYQSATLYVYDGEKKC